MAAMNVFARCFAGVAAAAALIASAPAAAQVTLSPGSHDYGVQPIANGATGAFIFTLSNTGGSTANISAMPITGTDFTEFAIDSSACGLALAASNACNIGVTFDPSSIGAKAAQLEV